MIDLPHKRRIIDIIYLARGRDCCCCVRVLAEEHKWLVNIIRSPLVGGRR